jgi:hypothetical protein
VAERILLFPRLACGLRCLRGFAAALPGFVSDGLPSAEDFSAAFCPDTAQSDS